MKLLHTSNSITIGDRTWPALIEEENFDYDEFDFKRRTAKLIFENGWVISIVWGDGTYSDNNYHNLDKDHLFIEEPEQVEIAVWNARLNTEMITWPDGDTVRPFTRVESLPELFEIVALGSSKATTFEDLNESAQKNFLQKVLNRKK